MFTSGEGQKVSEDNSDYLLQQSLQLALANTLGYLPNPILRVILSLLSGSLVLFDLRVASVGLHCYGGL